VAVGREQCEKSAKKRFGRFGQNRLEVADLCEIEMVVM
jgi:hypothetical protein